KEAKEQFAHVEVKSDRAVEFLPLHIFFHICSTKIPYKTAGKESIASEGDLKKYMKFCLSDLYRKVSAQIRKELRMKDAQNRLNLYKHYIPLIISAISESIKVDPDKLTGAFNVLAERHVKGEVTGASVPEKQDKITGERIEQEVDSEDGEQAAVAAARKKGTAEKKTAVPESLRKAKTDQKTLDESIDKKVRKK
ncbi:MAG TPA: hypothetical protein VJ742_04035, partial [Nitrososphaera sp.]|nr:hypothetical protein [Nitrososphaera sp.]